MNGPIQFNKDCCNAMRTRQYSTRTLLLGKKVNGHCMQCSLLQCSMAPLAHRLWRTEFVLLSNSSLDSARIKWPSLLELPWTRGQTRDLPVPPIQMTEQKASLPSEMAGWAGPVSRLIVPVAPLLHVPKDQMSEQISFPACRNAPKLQQLAILI
jgi:hypothetical protein